ncbi:uncharacterized protein LOC122304229 isoform X2 [Carya illinoinensis]|uniref:uncharacterized protein LOC122304229 isoform X2 n=1 Tax=Carya illinoinensis TaxID=32201 RepID=UPI001C718F45|nr:uncharacterized protein LOC122304229 isoform X2 [Carya illinoinensis]
MTLVSPPLHSNPHPLLFSSSKRHRFQLLEFRVIRRRRRLKTFPSRLSLRSQFNFPDLFHDLFSQFPSLNSFDFLAPLSLGFASAFSLRLSRFKPPPVVSNDDVGEWILFASPTTFNRFVFLRCPSISFSGSELLEDVNEKLVKEDRHFVSLNKGRMKILFASSEEEEEWLAYQRVCVSTDDGGVISLDWPANLDLNEEQGLDTTLLLVPGTPQGSMDTNVRSFVCEALQRGCFPVVMNPRGCAGSPLTTARLFSAADSDDISTAIQFINEARPCATLMAVGWGYGANMLTKYLAESGEKTPLSAATCIDNPFDLEEATRSSSHHLAIDQKLTGGLIDILRSNKELFQGKAKGFNVEKALLATSVRDFEKSISMVSYGFDALEDFYSQSSTRDAVGKVKIPVLYIQNDDGMVPLLSIPRDLIAENPFTSLLFCSSMPSSIVASSKSALSWCQHLTIEVLTAVNQGETLLQALQDAVPEDVRGKLTAAATGILQAQGTHLKFDGLRDAVQIPDVPSGLKSNIQEKVRRLSGAEGIEKDHNSSDQIKQADEVTDCSTYTQPGSEKPTVEPESDLSEEKSQRSVNLGQFQSTGGDGVDISDSVRKDSNELGNDDESAEFYKENPAPSLDYGEKGSETGVNPNFPSQTDKAGGSKEETINEQKDKDSGTAQLETREENDNNKTEEKTADSSTDRSKVASASVEELSLGSSSEAQVMETEDNDNQKKENKSMQPVQDQTKVILGDPSPPTFSVSQALDTLTGMDDSTQVAVNSVFGVLENMLNQLEEGSDEENGVQDRNDVEDSVTETDNAAGNPKLEEKEENESEQSMQSDTLGDRPVYNHHVGIQLPHVPRIGSIEEETMQYLSSSNGKSMDISQGIKNNIHVRMGKTKNKDQLVGSKLLADKTDKLRRVTNNPMYITANPYGTAFDNKYLRKHLVAKKHSKSLDLDSTAALLLDYFPEEGQWKLLEQPENIGISNGDVDENKFDAPSPVKLNDSENFIEPSYVIFHTEKQQEPVAEYETSDPTNNKVEISNDKLVELMQFVKNIVMDSLKVEVGRRLGAIDMKEIKPRLARDLEVVANAASLVVGHEEHIRCVETPIRCTSGKLGTLPGKHIIRAISSAARDTSYLRRVLPIGVIVGSSLAALRKSFNVATVKENNQREVLTHVQGNNLGVKTHSKVSVAEIDKKPFAKSSHKTSLGSSVNREVEKDELKNSNNHTVMVGAVTAALGASALLVSQQGLYKGNETAETSSEYFKVKANHHQEPENVEGSVSEKSQDNMVTCLAEKAMSVAGPVVPMKDGGVDQERLVAMLADLGQKGGLLKLVGKLALLWGGIRGAMSLTDKLISFLHIAERPLFQRILGFVGMVLVLWSPVAVPLLPTLVQAWTTNTYSGIAEFVCIIGLYAAIMILVMIWGRRIRGYEDPLEQYGLDLTSQKIHNFLKGLIGGIILVLSIHSVNALLGCLHLSWPPTPSPSDVMRWFKLYGKILMLAGQGLFIATSVATVEELLFRSWLPKEIAVDLGHHQGIIISGLAFSLCQRSPQAIPGLWLLSLGLAGAYQRSEGSLSVPIGLRAGIMASSFVLQKGGFLTYKLNFPLWVTGIHPFQPFSGVVGFAFALGLAIILYPRQPLQEKMKSME